ncbi:MAG: GNAT family N-acetyltransferase [Treponemataceae bacterium]|nr:GNAT family N-acetyltransferase [Treponemataceae bacterium]
MKIIEFYAASDKQHWLEKIRECDWKAGKYLYELLKTEKLKTLVGKDAKVLMLTDGKELISFCTLAEKDEIPTNLTPWIGFVYTFPNFRGNRRAGELLNYAENLAKESGAKNIYISTDHIGLYEKYGYEFFKMAKTNSGEDSRIYTKQL